jgi:hypothetical protein
MRYDRYVVNVGIALIMRLLLNWLTGLHFQ